MSLNRKDIITLGKQIVNATSTTFSYEGKEYNVSTATSVLREQLKELTQSYNGYRRNKIEVFEIMQEIVEDVLPKKVNENYDKIANIKKFPQGTIPVFTSKEGRLRAKQFITKVGLAGVYETFKLDKTSYEIATSAYGGAAQISIEEFLDGTIDLNDLVDIIVDGITDAIYTEIISALEATAKNLQGANKASGNGFVPASFDPLLTVVGAYGTPVIYTTLETASKIVPANGWVSDAHRNEMSSQGYVGTYKGAKVVVLPQSFTDATNTTKVVNDKYIYILPEMQNRKPIDIALEGDIVIDEYANRDFSKEIQAYQKFGVGLHTCNDICIYEITE